jgi:hypothetical protein
VARYEFNVVLKGLEIIRVASVGRPYHAAAAEDSLSCHLTIGITAPTRREVVSKVLGQLADRLPELDLPVIDKDDVESLTMRDDLGRLAELIQEESGYSFPRTYYPVLGAARISDLHRLLQGRAIVAGNGEPGAGAEPAAFPPGQPELADALRSQRQFKIEEITDGPLSKEWARKLCQLVLSGHLTIVGNAV